MLRFRLSFRTGNYNRTEAQPPTPHVKPNTTVWSRLCSSIHINKLYDLQIACFVLKQPSGLESSGEIGCGPKTSRPRSKSGSGGSACCGQSENLAYDCCRNSLTTRYRSAELSTVCSERMDVDEMPVMSVRPTAPDLILRRIGVCGPPTAGLEED